MGLKLEYCKKDEVIKVIEVMRQSGEWDGWKQRYLEHNWEEIAHTFEKIVRSQGELGIILVLKDGVKVVGALPLVRIGRESLLFGCSGVLEKYAEEGDALLDKELFPKIPEFYRTLLSYTRPSSLQWLPAFLRKRELKNMEDLLQTWHTFPEFFRKSINVLGPFNYCELLLKKVKRREKKDEILEKIKDYQLFPRLVSKAFDLDKDYKQITNLYRKYGLFLIRQIIFFPKLVAVCFAGSLGFSGSGYADSCLIFSSGRGIDLNEVFKEIAAFYDSQNKERAFIFFPSGISCNLQNVAFIKSLYQIYYDIPAHRDWRRRHLKS